MRLVIRTAIGTLLELVVGLSVVKRTLQRLAVSDENGSEQ